MVEASRTPFHAVAEDNPKIAIIARCSPLLSESGFTGFKDLQDFFHRIPSKIFLLLLIGLLAYGTRIIMLFINKLWHYFPIMAIEKMGFKDIWG
jgi:hypothetical protein